MLARFLILGAGVAALTAPAPALAWGYEGHQIIADIARAYMTPTAIAKVDAMLKTDVSNSLTETGMASEATWADAYRSAGHKETAAWHFVDIELDHPDLKSACFGFPAPANPPSSGPAKDCVVDKVDEFVAELSNSATPADERLLALKYVLHFVGDIHQPLHAADNQDRGGNCVQISLGGVRTSNLHSFWDTGVLASLGPDPAAAARTLRASITPVEVKAWSVGRPSDWAEESFKIARTNVYTLGSKPGCDNGQSGPTGLPAGYSEASAKIADLQLEKAGVRLAMVLNTAFEH